MTTSQHSTPPAGDATASTTSDHHSLSFGISTGAVARRLGVSPTTVRSWEHRYGIAPAHRQGGKHRRWAPEDVAMLEEMCRLTASGIPPAEAARTAMMQRRLSNAATRPAQHRPKTAPTASSPQPAPGSGLPLGGARPECRGLARAAVRLDSTAMEALLSEAVTEHGLVTAWEEVMAPTLHAVGRKWETADERYVEVEHLLSWHVSTALRKAAVAETTTRVDGSPVVLACTPAEQHTLPLEAFAAGIAEQGWPLRMFGAAVPAIALEEAVRRLGPAAVALWSQSRATADIALARQVVHTGFGLRGARMAPLVLLLGPGWPTASVEKGMARAHGLREAISTVSLLYVTPTAPLTA
ncbi:MerR family transcriptional regulator [Streptomyces yangpuensis]|uniref:MerR family transcriptional regulator n=1 Tax=Streptomyces yangpuensis TaxID=1648182 RepID=UPI003811BAF3